MAGASKEVDTLVPFLSALRAAGHTITHDWTTEVIYNRDKGGTDASLDSLDRLKYARFDAEGVMAADLLWECVPGTMPCPHCSQPILSSSNGAWVELGIAIGTYGLEHVISKRIVVSGDWPRSIFTEFADQKYATHREALLALCAEKS